MNSKLDVPTTECQSESEASDDYDGPPPAYRRNSESSTERSLYDEKDEALLANAAPSSHVREYGFYSPKVLTRGLVITDGNLSTKSNKVPLYYVEMSEFALKKPDVTLHELPPASGVTNDMEQLANTGESAPVIAIAHFPKFTRQIKAGLGDPTSAAGMTYVDVRNPNKVWHGEYQMSLNGKSYVWKRTHDAAAGVEGSAMVRRLHRNSFQLFDMASNEVVAVFLSNMWKSWLKKGKLRVFKDLDEPGLENQQLKLLIFLSVSALLEKARRRRNRRRNNGGGGGGP
jgi:hypothetical protein